ncbi:S-adenosyl-L-methionine-dependent methyltransferase [Calycina marina]|uniref:S-adenosyl-L-methionine-dependent methyltransferase n=1 Tax=Calycina marina TaxID=1763456 RepID=A0A9P8CEU2_9HELO|nr:S-adenosyl-L-methionine-dependent methyltransferase [Calycina marina]
MAEHDIQMDDPDVNAGQTTESGDNHSIYLAEESALQHLNVDYNDDADSALGGMTTQTSTMSVNSSIYNYVEENGRTYHRYKNGKYLIPNDEAEMDRLDLQHQLWLYTLHNQLFTAPIESPKNILDFGTGTGIWAIEVASQYPSSRVLGTDLSPIQPNLQVVPSMTHPWLVLMQTSVPPNCQFEVDDFDDEWNYSQTFDLIHGRTMVTCFKDPLAVITSAFNALSPGGYLELQDMVIPLRCIDDSIDGTRIEEWANRTLAASRAMGLCWQKSQYYSQYFEQAGFVDVVEQHFQWPINRWAKGAHMKVLGSWFMEDMSRALYSVSVAALTRGAGMSRAEVNELVDGARRELHDNSIHAYLPIVVVYGRKPDPAVIH